ncbi:SAM-dependent methyltransferase [Glycomyces terrestris]|uniref:SAM-dependent methyltransferase n=1 Tax=Glycomyces terrestris TaxID=2493553 RepID=A0A426UXP4_9ACTN|nr:SAM-dependent methyltransferase [Glycomyces terrestris]RRR99286.1 SAM-dependent methyltransferase [Glycomyces terrestris]
MHDDDIELPPGTDTTVPATARVYDALLGGSTNLAVDRAAADVFAQHVPQARECAKLNRSALIRGVEYLVGTAGMDQILDIGCGLPSAQNTHQVAAGINPDAKVVYVDHDPMVVAHAELMLAGNDAAIVIQADLTDPDDILSRTEIRAFLDFDRPVALLLVGMIMQISDEQRPNDIIAALMAALPSGSHLLLTAWPDTGEPAQAALSAACIETLGNGWMRPVPVLESHFLGMDMVAPGLEYIPRWYPGEPGRPVRAAAELEPYERTQMAGIARKP